MEIDKTLLRRLQDPATRRRSVIYILQLEHRSLSQVAAKNGVSRQCIYHAFRVPYPRMERLIAAALNLAPGELFPERYDRHGLPISRKRGRPAKSSCRGKKNTPASGRRNTQPAVAA